VGKVKGAVPKKIEEKWGDCLKCSPDAQSLLAAAVNVRVHEKCPLLMLYSD